MKENVLNVIKNNVTMQQKKKNVDCGFIFSFDVGLKYDPDLCPNDTFVSELQHSIL